MKKKVSRIAVTLLAFGLASLMIILFALVGDNSKGPIEDLFVKIGSTVDHWDNTFITNRGSRDRANSLAWFDTYRENLDSLRNPHQFLFGAYDNNTEKTFQPIMDIEQRIDHLLPLIHIYSAWGSEPEQRFPMTKANAIYSLGSIPVLTWEPWLTDFDADKQPFLRDLASRDYKGLTDISNGVYDFYLDSFAEDLETYGKPIYIRFGHEMNDPYRYSWGPQNNSPEEFVNCWKYVVDFFENHGVQNVIWVWSPHPAYGHFKEYYPGDDYVDWLGLGTLNYGDVAVWSQWWSLDEIYGNYYDELSEFNKPIMLTEFGSLTVGGDRAQWYEDALCSLQDDYPLTQSVVFFHYNNDYTLTNKALDWYFIQDSAVVNSVARCVDLF